MRRVILALLISTLGAAPSLAQGLSAGLTSTNPAPIATAGSTAPTGGTLVMGSDGTNARPLSTTSTGQLIVNTGSGSTADQIQGNTASGATDIGNPVKAGGVYNSTPPTFTTGQRGDLQVDFNGNLQVVVKPEANIFVRIASSAATGSPTNAKAAAGGAFGWWGINTSGANVYLQIYNKASAPIIGTDTPVLTYPIGSNSNFNQSIPNGGIYLSAGVGFAFTTDVAGTTATAAGAITSFGFIAS